MRGRARVGLLASAARGAFGVAGFGAAAAASERVVQLVSPELHVGYAMIVGELSSSVVVVVARVNARARLFAQRLELELHVGELGAVLVDARIGTRARLVHHLLMELLHVVELGAHRVELVEHTTSLVVALAPLGRPLVALAALAAHHVARAARFAQTRLQRLTLGQQLVVGRRAVVVALFTDRGNAQLGLLLDVDEDALAPFQLNTLCGDELFTFTLQPSTLLVQRGHSDAAGV